MPGFFRYNAAVPLFIAVLCFIFLFSCGKRNHEGGLKIFMITDMEGVAGVFNFEDWSYPDGRFYSKARHLTTLEVNAAVEGAIDGGASEVIVLDGHGAGSLNAEELHPDALLIAGGGYDFTALIDSTFDAVCMIGQHAMIHAPGGNMDHSWSSRTINDARLNGKPVGEIGVNTILAGYFGVPMVFLSGDTAACREMNAIVPGAVTVAVKEGISRAAAKSVSPAAARRAIREGMRKAIQTRKSIKPYFVPPPYILKYRFHEIVKQGKHNLPRYENVLADERIIQADNFLELLRKR